MQMYSDFVSWFEHELSRVPTQFAKSPPFFHPELFEGYVYALQGKGKRLRPYLLYLSAKSCAKELDEGTLRSRISNSALAIEMLHTYSLVHDDLPAMDNDDFRRGRPSCHKQFDEATAILVGDALLPDAIGLLSRAPHGLRQVQDITLAVGSLGMVLGQAVDLGSQKEPLTAQQWLKVHELKTGRLFACACAFGAMCVDADDAQIELFRNWGAHFGMAFQLMDDWTDKAPLFELLGDRTLANLIEESLQKAKKIASDLEGDLLLAFLTKDAAQGFS